MAYSLYRYQCGSKGLLDEQGIFGAVLNGECERGGIYDTQEWERHGGVGKDLLWRSRGGAM